MNADAHRRIPVMYVPAFYHHSFVEYDTTLIMLYIVSAALRGLWEEMTRERALLSSVDSMVSEVTLEDGHSEGGRGHAGGTNTGSRSCHAPLMKGRSAMREIKGPARVAELISTQRATR